MKIRRAEERDIPQIENLLEQVDLVHHKGRPDLFKIGTKYTEEELISIIHDEKKPILVAVNEQDFVCGYAFCIYQQHINDHILTDVKTLYIDDLCVDEGMRGKRIGKQLYHAAVVLAKESGCYNLTLNVWSCNEGAMRFYEKMGLKPLKVGMEKIL